MQSACVQKLIDVLFMQNLGRNEEIDNAICEFLHSYWIENFSLIKLVHTHGYPKKLLSITVNKIGSLICTWDFILDLVQKGTSKQQRFALQLAGHLSYKYPTQRLLEILRSCIQFIEENLHLFSEDNSLDYTLDLYVKAFGTLNGRVKKLKRKFPKNFFNFETVSLQLIR
jgi:Integrator complex subunit 2